MKPYYFVLSLLSIFVISCDRDTDVLYPDPIHPDQKLFRSSLFVEVVDASGSPVANTLIHIGNYKRKTDVRGFLYLQDVLVGATTYLTAEKDGYFHASRRFYPTSGSSLYIKIIMLSDTRDAFFSSDAGAVLPLGNDVTIHFPKDGYEYADGAPYDGTVVVSAEVISADDPQLSYKMPGDLTGIDANGQPGSLASLGMVAVEMKSSTGSLLKLKKEMNVQIEMKIAPSRLNLVPTTIPMWYFNEDEGIWKEEGAATLSGNLYVANVAHFSYWNYDASFPGIKWGATFDFSNRGIASELEVCITILSLNTTKCEYTNSEGSVCGLVAANELLLMEVKNKCGDILYSAQIGPYAEATMIGPITLADPGIFMTTMSGLAVTCDGAPVTNGYATISIGDFTQHAPLDEATGAFTFAVSPCGESDLLLSMVDVGNNKLTLPMSFPYAPVIDAGTITVCESNEEFIDLEVVGFPDHYYFFYPEMGRDVEYTNINASDGFSQGSQIHFWFFGQYTGIHEVNSGELSIHLPNDEWFYAEDSLALDFKLDITHYGDVGDYITGTINGTCIQEGSGSPAKEYPFVGSFKVLREE